MQRRKAKGSARRRPVRRCSSTGGQRFDAACGVRRPGETSVRKSVVLYHFVYTYPSISDTYPRIRPCPTPELGNQRHKEQAAFNTKVSHELQAVRKQIDLTQADVDEARQGASPVGLPAPSQIAAAAFGAVSQGAQPDVAGQARLADDGPPLIPERPQAQLGAATQARQHHYEAYNGYRGRQQYHQVYNDDHDSFVKPPKHDFPRFDGHLPSLWIDRCLSYFELYHTPAINWVTTASLYLDGHAALWWQAFHQSHMTITWEMFSRALQEEFGPDEFEVQMHALLQLRQTGTVTSYRLQFETYMHQLLAMDPGLSTKFFMTQLRADVRIQAPTSITRASVFARIQEEELEVNRPRP
nr:uncharacterized protein LOC127347084 [Lolium perenne]